MSPSDSRCGASPHRPGITARVLAEPVTGCVAILVTRKVRAAGKLEDAHAEPSDAAGIAWRWTTIDTPVEPLLRCPIDVLDAIVDARLAQRQELEHRIPVRLYRFRQANGVAGRLGICAPDWNPDLVVEIEDRDRPSGAPHTLEVCDATRRTIVMTDRAPWRPWTPDVPAALPADEVSDEHWQDPLDLYPATEAGTA